MDTNDMDDGPTVDMEMSPAEAAGYLSGLVGYGVSAEVLDSLRALGLGPVAEQEGRTLTYRRSALDAFLRENGTGPMAWMAGVWRNVADQYEAATAEHPELRSARLIEKWRSRDSDDWDPDKAK